MGREWGLVYDELLQFALGVLGEFGEVELGLGGGGKIHGFWKDQRFWKVDLGDWETGGEVATRLVDVVGIIC